MKSKIFLALVFTGLFFIGCKKDKAVEPDSSQGSAPTGTFMLHLHTNIDTTEVEDYDTVYTTASGRSMSLSMAQFYISEVQLVKLDGSTYDIPDAKILKVLETEQYVVANVPVGNYKSFRFKVGLNAATNQLNPATPSDSALLNKPAMWFGSPVQPDGYVFLNVQGKIDTTAAMNGALVPFSYKIGTNANYKQVNLPDKNFSIIQDQVEYGHLTVDYSQLLNGIQLNQSANLTVTTAAANSTTIAATIVNNIPSMFSYEE